jgi:hypothetical protein
MTTLTHHAAPMTGLAAELDRARRDRDQAMAALDALRSQFDQFRTAVRRRVIEAVNDRDICRPGANEALRAWGMPVLRVQFDATVEVGIAVTVVAVDEDAAAWIARQVADEECAQLVDGEAEASVHIDIDIDSVRHVENPRPAAEADTTGTDLADLAGRLTAYRVGGTLHAEVTVSAEDEDDAADAAMEAICDRNHRLDRVSAGNPRCTSVAETDDHNLDPDTD